MNNILASFFSLFKTNNNPQTKQEDLKPEKIINRNGRLFFELSYLRLDEIIISNNSHYFYTTISSDEMLRSWNYKCLHKRFPDKKYSIVLIPISEIENPKERFTKRFIEIATKDYGEKSVNSVVGELGPAIASFLTPKDLKENNIKSIVIPHEVIPDLDENCLFIIEQNHDEKNSLVSFESYGRRGEDNLWEDGNIYLAFVVYVEGD
ncbi:MAG: hypothetical protein QG630_241 [Patescibacteria group bacterium]|nr:hypothetical protein [Patescibacteria group bacterium]